MRRFLLVVMVCALTLGPTACNDDDGAGGSNGGGDDLYGVLITGANAEELASTVASTMDFFSGINRAFLLILDAIETHGFYDGYPMPEDGYDLGDLGLCPTGTLVAKWMDVDDSKSLSTGDTVHIDLTDCGGEISGSLDLAFTAASIQLTRAEISYDLVIEDTVDGTPQTKTVAANYIVEVYQDPAYNLLSVSHRVSDQTDGGAGLVVTIDGEPAYRVGCFNFYFAMNLETGGFLLSEPYAVFKLADRGVMTLNSYGLDPYDFPDDNTPVAGESILWAESGSLPCSGLDIPSGGVDANDSFLHITVADGGAITLSGETDSGGSILVETDWDELR